MLRPVSIGKLAVSAMLVFLAGCGGGVADAPKTVPAKGVVTYKGNPVSDLSVALIPDKGMLASGMTDANGQFVLTTSKPNDGAVPGYYKVAVRHSPNEIPEMPGFPGAPKKPPASPIPMKYADPKTSAITITVGKDASANDFKIELTD